MGVTNNGAAQAVKVQGAKAPTMEDMAAELARLRGENAALRSKRGAGLTLKVAASGGVSLYGVGRWPVTLYNTQWESVISLIENHTLQDFLVAHASELKQKPTE